jgi:hypothetical protein
VNGDAAAALAVSPVPAAFGAGGGAGDLGESCDTDRPRDGSPGPVFRNSSKRSTNRVTRPIVTERTVSTFSRIVVW